MANPYSDLRTFIKNQICEVDSKLKHDGTVTDVEAYGLNKINNVYKITYGDLSNETSNLVQAGSMPVSVTLWRNLSASDRSDDEDYFQCKALTIALKCSDFSALNQLNTVKRVFFNGIDKTTVENNDNLIQLTLQFSVSLYYGL